MLVQISTDRGTLILGSDGKEREFSWLDNSDIADFSADGKMLLIHERGEGGDSPGGTVFMRSLDGSPGVRLGGGAAMVFSPDGKLVLAEKDDETLVIPTGAGSIRSFKFNECTSPGESTNLHPVILGFLPDSKHFLHSCLEKDGFWKVYSQNIEGGGSKPLGLEKLRLPAEYEHILSPNGNFLIAFNADGKLCVYPLNGSAVRLVIGLEPGETPIQWSADSSSIFVYDPGKLPASVYKLNVTTGQRTFFKEMTPPDRAGVDKIQSIRISHDEKSYAFSYASTTGTLYTLDGLPRPKK